jgi:hypothetical protein
MLGKILGFGRMQQNIFFLFENVSNFFFEIFRRKPGILIPVLYLQCKYTTRYHTKVVEKYLRKSKFLKMISEIFWNLFSKKLGPGQTQPHGLGQNWPDPKAT